MGEGPHYRAITPVRSAMVGQVPHTTIAREQGRSRGKRVASRPHCTTTLIPQLGPPTHAQAPAQLAREYGLGLHVAVGDGTQPERRG